MATPCSSRKAVAARNASPYPLLDPASGPGSCPQVLRHRALAGRHGEPDQLGECCGGRFPGARSRLRRQYLDKLLISQLATREGCSRGFECRPHAPVGVNARKVGIQVPALEPLEPLKVFD